MQHSEVIDVAGDVRAVQALLGHASLATTQRYLGLTDDQLTRAAAWAA